MFVSLGPGAVRLSHTRKRWPWGWFVVTICHSILTFSCLSKRTIETERKAACDYLYAFQTTKKRLFQEKIKLQSKHIIGNFPGSPMVKTSPSNGGGTGSIPAWRAKMPPASRPKSQNRRQRQYLTNSIKTLKMVHIKSNLKARKSNHIMEAGPRKSVPWGNYIKEAVFPEVCSGR